jgi:hypothetical protein
MKVNNPVIPDLSALANAPKLADEALRSSLQLVSDRHQEQEASLKLEQQRLAFKYGQDSKQARTAAQRIEAHQQMRVGIKVHLERSKVQSPQRSPDNFILYGRVLQEDGEGVGALAVSAIDQKSQSIAQAKTDERGAFQLTIAPSATATATKSSAKEVIESEAAATPWDAQMRLRLQVSDSRKKILFEDDEPFQPAQGRLSYREIVLSEQVPAARAGRAGKAESRERATKTESKGRSRS